MRGRPGCLFQSARGEADRILLASALSSMHIICPNRVSRCDWIIAVSLGCFVSLRTSSFRTNCAYHLFINVNCSDKTRTAQNLTFQQIPPTSILLRPWTAFTITGLDRTYHACRFISSSFFCNFSLCSMS